MKLLNMFLLLLMTFIQAQKVEVLEVEDKKEFKRRDPNDPNNFGKLKKQALEHEARWKAMSMEEKEIAIAKYRVIGDHEFSDQEVNHIYGDSHQALLSEGLTEAAETLAAEWAQVKAGGERRHLLTLKAPLFDSLSNICKGSKGTGMAQCINDFGAVAADIAKVEAYFKGKSEELCGMSDEEKEYVGIFSSKHHTSSMGKALMGRAFRPEHSESNSHKLCKRINKIPCDSHEWACWLSRGTICFYDTCAVDSSRCIEENFTTFVNWAQVAANVAGMLVTGGSSSILSSVGSSASLMAVQKATTTSLTRSFAQTTTSMASGLARKSAAMARATSSLTWAATGLKAGAKNFVTNFLQEGVENIGDKLVEKLAEELVFMASVGQQKTIFADAEDVAWEIGLMVDPTGIANVVRYYLERPECIFESPQVEKAALETLEKDAVGILPHNVYEAYHSCEVVQNLGFWHSPASCATSEKMLGCKSKKFQWKSPDDMCGCCVSDKKSTYTIEHCMSLVDGGCDRNEGLKDVGGLSLQEVPTPWSVYEAVKVNLCPEGYVRTFGSEQNGACEMSRFLFEETNLSSLEACADLCSNNEYCTNFNYRDGRCVGVDDCGQQVAKNGYLSCAKNQCPAGYEPYFAGSPDGSCVDGTRNFGLPEYLGEGLTLEQIASGIKKKIALEPTTDKKVSEKIPVNGITTLEECAQSCTDNYSCTAMEWKDGNCVMVGKCLRQNTGDGVLTCAPIYPTYCPEGYVSRDGFTGLEHKGIMAGYDFDLFGIAMLKSATKDTFWFRDSDERAAMLRRMKEESRHRYTEKQEYLASTQDECKNKCESDAKCLAFEFSPRQKNCFLQQESYPRSAESEMDFQFCAKDIYQDEYPPIVDRQYAPVFYGSDEDLKQKYCNKNKHIYVKPKNGQYSEETRGLQCGACEGECVSDADCLGDLKCYMRDDKRSAHDWETMKDQQPVPGCRTTKESLAIWQKKMPHLTGAQIIEESAHKDQTSHNYCYDPNGLKKNCFYTKYPSMATEDSKFNCSLTNSSLWIYEKSLIKNTVEVGAYEIGKRPKGLSKDKKSHDRGFFVLNENECRRQCDSHAACKLYMYIVRDSGERRCYLGKGECEASPVNEGYEYAKLQKKTCHAKAGDYRQRPGANIKCQNNKYKLSIPVDVETCAYYANQLNMKHFTYNDYSRQCFLSDDCDATYQEKSCSYEKHGFKDGRGNCDGLLENFLVDDDGMIRSMVITGPDGKKISPEEATDDIIDDYTGNLIDGYEKQEDSNENSLFKVMKLVRYSQHKKYASDNWPSYVIGDEYDCQRSCDLDKNCKYYMAGSYVFGKSIYCVLWKHDHCMVKSPKDYSAFARKDDKNDLFFNYDDAKSYAEDLLKQKQGHFMLPSTTKSQSGNGFYRMQAGFLIKKKVCSNKDSQGWNWQVYDILNDGSSTHDWPKFTSFPNEYCPDVCEECQPGEHELVHGKCHNWCSNSNTCGSDETGTDCSGCAHTNSVFKPIFRKRSFYDSDGNELYKMCERTSEIAIREISKERSREDCEKRAVDNGAFFYSYRESRDEGTNCQVAKSCSNPRTMNPDLGKWNIFERVVEYKIAVQSARCRQFSHKIAAETQQECEREAYIQGFEVYSYKNPSVSYVGSFRLPKNSANCLMSGNGCGVKKNQIPTEGMAGNNWNIYFKEEHTAETSIGSYARVEEPQVIDISENRKSLTYRKTASIEESDLVEEPQVIDISENLKFTSSLEESVATLETKPMIQVFAIIGVIFIGYSAYKRCNKSDYVDVPGTVEQEYI